MRCLRCSKCRTGKFKNRLEAYSPVNTYIKRCSSSRQTTFINKIFRFDVYIKSYRPKSIKIDQNNDIFGQYARKTKMVMDFFADYFRATLGGHHDIGHLL